MNEVNQTLYIPLYGKSLVSKRGILLSDPRAEKIWQEEGFRLTGKSASKWLAYYMGMRAAVFDDWTGQQLSACPEAVVLHLGCGMDSRCQRVSHTGRLWIDVDFPEVIAERRRYFRDSEDYRMLPADLRSAHWLDSVPGSTAIVIMEGVSMYLTRQELTGLFSRLSKRFSQVSLLMDCYSEFAARASRYKNPINDVGVTQVYGLDDPENLTHGTCFTFVTEHSMTPDHLIQALSGWEQKLFRRLYAGRFASKLYRLYEFRREEADQN